ncbi:hypothetical protein RJ639_002014 [Escallonia herrerae]|uniref:Uncharacterized protein n=1 Tax=Escallonia herrerae TaxID=1293975 RepID=A0AA88XJ75_9ASTE|nr:hypothetical protein RJ639_002014 [Escallonia herrerae]
MEFYALALVKKVRYESNYGLYQSCSANWRNTALQHCWFLIIWIPEYRQLAEIKEDYAKFYQAFS